MTREEFAAQATVLQEQIAKHFEGTPISFTLILWDAEGYCVRGNGRPEHALPALHAVTADIEAGAAVQQKPKLSS